MRSLAWALLHSNWCPYRREEDTDKHKGKTMGRHREKMAQPRRGASGERKPLTTDPRLLAPRTARKCLLLKPPT